MRSKTWHIIPSLILCSLAVLSLSAPQVSAEEQIRYDDGPLMRSHSEFMLDGRNWLPKIDLTYGFINLPPNLDATTAKAAFAEAFALWAAVTPLTFTEISDCAMPFDYPNCTAPDIRIQFSANNHGDGAPFDGPGRTLAHAFFPPPNGYSAAGDMHFDETEAWFDDVPSSGIDLVTVVAHEIGHALGLFHAEPAKCPDKGTGESSLMCPVYTGARRFLAQDDIEGVQAIYGPGTCIDDQGDTDFVALANLDCRLRRLSIAVQTADLSVSLAKTLTSKLTAARKRADEAHVACASAKEAVARKKLEASDRNLESFQQQIANHAAKGRITPAAATVWYNSSMLGLQQLADRLALPSVCY